MKANVKTISGAVKLVLYLNFKHPESKNSILGSLGYSIVYLEVTLDNSTQAQIWTVQQLEVYSFHWLVQ